MNVLISRPDKIGDVILALHAAKQLKVLMPEVSIYMHVAGYTAELVRNVKFIDKVITWDEDLDDYEIDAVVDLMAKSRPSVRYFKRRIPIRIGNAARWFCFLYNKRRIIRRSRAFLNEAEYNWQLVALLDGRLKNRPLQESVTVSDFKKITPYSEFSDYYVLMPGVSVSAQGWDRQNWLLLARLLAKDEQIPVIFLLGPAEKALADYFKPVCEQFNNVHVRSFDKFPDLIGLLDGARAYIGPSTGITHLASCVNTPGVALYPEIRSMHPNRWSPFNSCLEVVSLSKKPTAEDVLNVVHGGKTPELETVFHEKISAFVVCCNEEKNIRRCLESIKWCDDILVVDSGSTDKTLEIVREYTDNIIERPWPGHSEQKHFALKQCKHNWVLNIDSDEEVSMELRSSILRILSAPDNKRNQVKGYNISRIVYYLDRWWDKGGWYPEYRMRLLNKDYTVWGGTNPHEKALVDGPVKRIKEPIYHYTYSGLPQQISALNYHSTSFARCMYREGQKPSLFRLITHPIARFFKFYFLKMGFRHGLPGFIVALIEASYTLFKYAKLWELHDLNQRDTLNNERLDNISSKDHD